MRLKGLDGIRSICAMLILLGHMVNQSFVDWSVFSLPLPECIAYVFFMISGILAGYRIDYVSSAKSYYIKKAKRILPLYYLYILIVLLVFPLIGRGSEVFNATLFYYLFLTPSIPFAASNGIIPLVHLWFIGSLVIFYLVIPVFAQLKHGIRKNSALAIAVLWFAIKIFAKICGGGFLYYFIGCTSFDILFIGVWGGMAIRDGLFNTAKTNCLIFSVFAWGMFLSSGFYGHLIPAPIRTEFIALLSLIIIVTQQRQNSCPLLENKVAHFLGNISYEIYVGHILVIILLSEFYQRMNYHVADWLIYVMATMLGILFAIALKMGASFLLASTKSKRSLLACLGK